MPLPGFRFAILGARQLSKPLVLAVVRRAQHDGKITRAICMRLGRVSLGISAVMNKWVDDEARKTRHLLHPAPDAPDAPGSRLAMAPRSRPLLHREGPRAGWAGRIFFARPVQSALTAFRAAYREPRAEEELVASGAEMFVEFVVFFLLAVLLYLEIKYAAELAGAKERALLQRIEKLEAEVNKLIEQRHDELERLVAPRQAEAPSRMAYLKNILHVVAQVPNEVR